MDQKQLEQKIIQEQPFKEEGITVVKADSLKGKYAVSGETFKVADSKGNLFKLRICNSPEQADRIETGVKRLPHLFPPFIGRSENDLLFEWVKGIAMSLFHQETGEIPIDMCYQIGKMVGETHALNLMKGESPDVNFLRRLKKIKKAKKLSVQKIEQVERRYRELRDKLRPDVVAEIYDIHSENFIITKPNDSTHEHILYVDEDGFSYRIKGSGLARLLMRSKYFKTQEHEMAFWKGYNEYHDSDYFDADYEVMVKLVRCIEKISKSDHPREYYFHTLESCLT